MIKRLTTAATAAIIAATAVSGAALAQPGPDRHGPPGHEDRYDHRGPPAHAYGHDRDHHWRRGERIERDMWRRSARVDWRRHHLRAPPRGYEWRQVNGDYVLAAAASGLIASIIIASH